METYLLPNYQLSCMELLQSLVVSQYGLRHLEQAYLQPEHKWGHRLIALIEFIPVIGQIAMLVERIAFQVLQSSSSKNNFRLRNEWLFHGSQRECIGLAHPERVLRILDRIDRCKERGIGFNRNKVTGSIDGGVCTAMALDFAESFFSLRKIHVEIGQHSSDIFLNRIRDVGRKFAESSEEMRIRQAAFNTIEARADGPGIDIGRNKIQSLANLHHFRIDHTSQEIQINRADYQRSVEEEVSKLPDGLYLLRTILPSRNEKLEVHGHSMIYVKGRQ
jgi:hypothetical protein